MPIKNYTTKVEVIKYIKKAALKRTAVKHFIC